MSVSSYTVSEVSEQTGLSTHTLRWYEQVGLLDPVTGTPAAAGATPRRHRTGCGS